MEWVTHAIWFAGLALASTVLVTPIPQEPVVFYGATLWSPLIVAVIMTAASCVSAVIDYRLLPWVSSGLQKVSATRVGLKRFSTWFQIAPFPVLIAANLLPIPFAPFKLACVETKYPLRRYQLALVLSRLPRYFLLATIGRTLAISPLQIALLMFALLGISFLHRRRPETQGVVS